MVIGVSLCDGWTRFDLLSVVPRPCPQRGVRIMPDIARTRSRRIRVVVAAGCVVALVGAGGALLASRSSEPRPAVATGEPMTKDADDGPRLLTQPTPPAEYGNDVLEGDLWVTDDGCVVIRPLDFAEPEQAVAWPPGWTVTTEGESIPLVRLWDSAGRLVEAQGGYLTVGGQLGPADSRDSCGQGPVWIAGPADAIGRPPDARADGSLDVTRSLVDPILHEHPRVAGTMAWNEDAWTLVIWLVDHFEAEAAQVRAEMETAIAAHPRALRVAFGTAQAPMEELGALSEAVLYSRETWATDPSQVYWTMPDPVTGTVHVAVEELSVADGLDRSRTLPSGITVTIEVDKGEPAQNEPGTAPAP